MTINITGNNLDLTPALKAHVESHLATLDKLLAKYEADSVQINVVLSRTTRHHNHGDVYQAEINLSVPKKVFVAKSEGSDMWAIFDEAKDKLKQEVVKYKEKLSDHRG